MQLDLSCRVFLDNVAAESEFIIGNLVILYKQQLDAEFTDGCAHFAKKLPKNTTRPLRCSIFGYFVFCSIA